MMILVDILHQKLGLRGPDTLYLSIAMTAMLVLALIASVLIIFSYVSKVNAERGFFSFVKFFYASFLKPHDPDTTGQGGQQYALESFYRTQVLSQGVPNYSLVTKVMQASVYDATRKRLLQGREDMLGLVGAQLRYRSEKGGAEYTKPIWVDVWFH